MALTADQRAAIRDTIGDATPPTDADLDTYHDRLGAVEAVTATILRRRLADLLGQPTSFNVTGVYAQSNDGRIRELAAQLIRAETAAELAAGTGGVLTGRLVRDDVR